MVPRLVRSKRTCTVPRGSERSLTLNPKSVRFLTLSSIGCDKCVTDPSLNFDDFTGYEPQGGKIGFRRRYCNTTWNSAGNPAPMINSTLPKEEHEPVRHPH